MNIYKKIVAAALLINSSASFALDGAFAEGLAKEMEKGCRSELVASGSKAQPKVAAAYCSCMGREVAFGMSEPDFVSLANGRETPNLTRLTQESGRICTERHLVPAAQNKINTSRYVELPDVSGGKMVRVRSGVFVPKFEALAGSTSLIADTDAVYSIKRGDFVCSWSSAPMDQKSTREALADIKKSVPELARLMLKTSEVNIVSIEDMSVRGNPTALIEFRGDRSGSHGQKQPTVVLYGVVIEVAASAVTNGFCIAEGAQYQSNKTEMRKLVFAALPSKKFILD